ncbi:hypothetical protein [Actinoplanes sp. URMC 104]|uniref:hypothetical protein n=1 Tax=Actinoplanes sp. URMC 104 TaxID=3423409 RepID=UPI003F1956DB
MSGGYLGTGINDLDAAKRYLRRRFRQDPLPRIKRRPGARFYVVARHSGRTVLLLGPYVSHMTALANVERGRRLAVDRFSDEMTWATVGTMSAAKTYPTTFGR